MNVRAPTPTMTTEESDLVRQIEILIGKIVAGTATAEDRRRYVTLSKRRVDLMLPSFRIDHERRREKVA
jgi:hypothetical protein